MTFDLLIRNGLVLDGSGSEAQRADVGIRADRIEAVGHLEGAEAARVIDAQGQAVSPGFIDTHVHSDVMILANPQHAPKLCQGVTTEVLAQDGLSYAPLSPANLQFYRRYLAGAFGNPDIAWDWSSVAEFRARFDRTVAVNTVYLVPHGAVRLEVLGMRDAPLVGDDLKRAQAIVEQGMDEGAVGFSTGLSYYPNSYADTDELVELCRPVAKRGGPYVTHIRTVFRDEPIDPVEETLEIGRRSGVGVHFSHFRTAPASAGKVAELMAAIDVAQAQGVEVTLDTYPYPSGAGFGLAFLPPWSQEGGVDDIVARLNNPTQRASIIAEMAGTRDAIQPQSWDERIFSHLPSPHNRELVGRSFSEAARLRGYAQVEELLCDLLAEEALEVGNFQAPPPQPIWERIERDIMELFARPNYMVGSDSVPAGDHPHPRLYGTFPRLLGRFRREFGGLSLETLVNRATLAAANRFGLRDRGLLAPGKAADVVIFNPDTLSDTATYEQPHSYPIGIDYVLVNGQIAVQAGKPTGVLAGRPLP